MRSIEDAVRSDLTQNAQRIDILKGVETVVKAIRSERTPENLLSKLCEKVIEIFGCDRAWLLFPCDPTAPSWHVPFERTVPEFPGAADKGITVTMTKEVAEIFQAALDSESPVIYGPGGLPLAENTKLFAVRSQMSMAIFPRVGKPWQFGVHQCSYNRIWNDAEVTLFRIIGSLTAEALGNILLLNDLENLNQTLEARVEEQTSALRAERDFAQSVIDTAHAIVLLLDTEGKIIHFNKYFEDLTGHSLENLRGADWFSTFVPRCDQRKVRRVFSRLLRETPEKGVVNQIHTKDGQQLIVEWYNEALKDPSGHITLVLAIGHDVTERVNIETKLRESLEEKEILFREIHHRVKNNLQVVTGLLSLQAMYALSTETRAALAESGRRIKLMAQIHDQLYRFPNISKLRFDDFLGKLAKDIVSSFEVDPGRITLETAIAPVRLEIDQILPCGQIVSELLSNCLKHAFPEGRDGRIWIEVTVEDGEVAVWIKDNGIGLRKDFDIDQSDTLGLQIVAALTQQLEGKLELVGDGGTGWRISFPRHW